MKIVTVLIACIFLCASAYAGVLQRGAEKIEGIIGIGDNKCPECRSCPEKDDVSFKDIKRSPFEVEARLNGFMTPSGGSPQFRTDSFGFTFAHNFSAVLKVYASYDISNIDKTAYENSLYDEKWSYQSITAGVGWYVHPVIEIFFGAGKTFPDNSEGSEELDVTIEYGIKVYMPINALGYRFVCGLLSREAPLADDNTDIQRSQADGSTNIIFAGVSLPIGW